MKKEPKITWYGVLNMVLLQWLFMRIVTIKYSKELGNSYDGYPMESFGMLCWVLPITGWFSSMTFTTKDPYIQIFSTTQIIYLKDANTESK